MCGERLSKKSGVGIRQFRNYGDQISDHPRLRAAVDIPLLSKEGMLIVPLTGASERAPPYKGGDAALKALPGWSFTLQFFGVSGHPGCALRLTLRLAS